MQESLLSNQLILQNQNLPQTSIVQILYANGNELVLFSD